MAISFVGSAVGSSSPNTGTSVDVSGIGIQADDLILVAAAVGDTANNGLAAPTQGGYSRVPGVAATLYANDNNDTNLDLYYKIAVGTETTVSFAAVGGANASNAAVVIVFRGVDTTTPFDTNANTATGIDTSNADPPSHDWSGTAGGWTVIAASTGHTGGATATFTYPTGYSGSQAQIAHNDTIDVLVGVGYNINPADPENPAAFSAANIGTAANNSWAAVTMSLKEAAPPNQTVTPSAIVVTASIALPVVARGGIVLTPSPFSVAASIALPTVTNQPAAQFVTPTPVIVAASILTPAILLGGRVLTPSPIVVVASIPAPTIIIGGIIITPDFIVVLATIATPVVIGGAGGGEVARYFRYT